MKFPIAIVVLAVSMSGCSSVTAPEGDVDMTAAQEFAPERLTVAAGESIVFSNGSQEVHTVTAYEDELPDGGDFFASGGASSEEAARDDLRAGFIDPGETFELTIDAPGTYRYFCIPHETQGMIGTIVVEDG